LQRRRHGKPRKLQEPLQLCRIVAHHVDDLSRRRLGPTRRRDLESLAIQEGRNGRADKDGGVIENGQVLGLQEGYQQGYHYEAGDLYPRIAPTIKFVGIAAGFKVGHEIVENQDGHKTQEGTQNVIH